MTLVDNSLASTRRSSQDGVQLRLRPRANFLPGALLRLRSDRPVMILLLTAAIAALGAAFAFGHNFVSPLTILTVVVGLTAILLLLVYGWLYLMLLGTQWIVYSDRVVLRRPGTKTLELHRGDIAAVRRESISGFGTNESIYVFENADHELLFWTVGRRWSTDDLSKLWQRLGVEPIDAQADVISFQALPYDRRF